MNDPTAAQIWQQLFSQISHAAATIVLSLLGGVAGSALLEMIWRPRRERRRVIGLLGAEIAFNANLLIMHTHSRTMGGGTVPSDLLVSTMAWSAAGSLVREIPTEMLSELILLYNRFEHLNRHVARFDELNRMRNSYPQLAAERTPLELELRQIEDVFNMGVDAAINQSKEISVELIRLGKMPKLKQKNTDPAEAVKKMLDDRKKRLDTK